MIWLPGSIAYTQVCGPRCFTEPLDQIVGWVMEILGWVAGIAAVMVGAVFLYSYFGGFGGIGSSSAIRSLGAVAVGCLLISTSSAIASALLQ